MTRVIARLVLAMLLLPLSGALMVILLIGLTARQSPPDLIRVIGIWGIMYVFIGAYWVMLWRGVVVWTIWRRRATFGALAGSLLAGACLGALAGVRGAPTEMAVLVGGGLPPIVWVLLSVLIWRESAGERLARLAANGADSLACPLCGYNLSGLFESRCPECGGKYTLQELVASQHQADIVQLPDA